MILISEAKGGYHIFLNPPFSQALPYRDTQSLWSHFLIKKPVLIIPFYQPNLLTLNCRLSQTGLLLGLSLLFRIKMLLGVVHVEAAYTLTGSTNCAVLKYHSWSLVGKCSKPGEIIINLSQHKLITVY